MPQICYDESRFAFPSVDEADEEGLVLIGGRVTPQRVLDAYARGLFPWFTDDALPLWWSPDPRFVLLPGELHTSRSMRKLFSKPVFSFRINTAFDAVLQACAYTERKGETGTWLTPQMMDAYSELHRLGYAHSAEAWQGDELVGGVYGLRLGRVFFRESMFSRVSNASKFAFIRYVLQAQTEGVSLVDCQVYSEHVERLGGRLISRTAYLRLLQDLL